MFSLNAYYKSCDTQTRKLCPFLVFSIFTFPFFYRSLTELTQIYEGIRWHSWKAVKVIDLLQLFEFCSVVEHYLCLVETRPSTYRLHWSKYVEKALFDLINDSMQHGKLWENVVMSTQIPSALWNWRSFESNKFSQINRSLNCNSLLSAFMKRESIPTKPYTVIHFSDSFM